jgi:hypothetical protein
MSSIGSNSEDLILNADGGSSTIKLKINGTEKASVSSAGAFTSTTIDATALTGNLPAISGANLTGVNAVNSGRKNMIINGAMQVSQRQGTSSFALTDSTFGIDRFKYVGQTSRLTSQQVTDSPAGFNYSYKLTSVGANTPGSSHGSGIWMQLEGDDVGHLNYGTSDAKTTTLSFWVKSSLTGTFGGAFANSALNRSYPFTYAISSANTWEKKSITVAGDTTGTWVTTGTVIGLRMYINTGTGSNFNGSAAGSWTGADRRDVSGTVQLEATSGATLQITGVQLELGSVATDFEYRSYAEELALCKRYYYRTATGTAYSLYGAGFIWTTGNGHFALQHPVSMRAAPSMTSSGNFRILHSQTAFSVTVTGEKFTKDFSRLNCSGSGFTINAAFSLANNNDANAYIEIDAEL